MRTLNIFTISILLTSIGSTAEFPLFNSDFDHGRPVWSQKTEQAIVQYFRGNPTLNPDEDALRSVMESSKYLYATPQAIAAASNKGLEVEYGVSTVYEGALDKTGQPNLQRYFPLPGMSPAIDAHQIMMLRMMAKEGLGFQVIDFDTPSGRLLMKVAQAYFHSPRGLGVMDKLSPFADIQYRTGADFPMDAALMRHVSLIDEMDPSGAFQSLARYGISLPAIGEPRSVGYMEMLQNWWKVFLQKITPKSS